MKKLITITIAVLSLASAFAQGSDDACQFSQTYYQGTAKALGMGNAMGAVGGDMTAVCINPAGLGLYRSDELTTTLDFLDNYHQSSYYGETHGANKFRLTMPNFGYVNTKQRSNYKPLRFTQFGIGLTRTNEFNYRTYAKGFNPTSSKIDNYLAQIDGYAPSELQEAFPYTIYPAWATYLIDIYQDEIGDYYDSPVPQGNLWQSQESTFKGRSEEWTFSGSANLAERCFIGISAGLDHIKRIGTRVFEETLPEQATVSDFNRWNYTETLSSTGLGGNVKVGFIYHANGWLRFGAAFHSPTIYAFDESWQTETESKINWITNKYISPESHYEYVFISPLKWIGSLAFVAGQQGLVSLDVEYTNFGMARFYADDYDYDLVNAETKSLYGRTLNFRIGTEWRMGGLFFRAGGAYYGSPYGLGSAEGSTKKASLGLSLPVSEYTTFDFAYELTHGKSQYILYDAGSLGIEPVTQQQFKSNLAITLRLHY